MKQRADGRYVKVMNYKTPAGEIKKKWFYGISENDVITQISEFKEELEAGKHFKAIAKEWEKEHFPTLEYNTIKPYKPALRRAIEEFEDYRINQITAPMINKFIQRFAKKGYARKTVSHQLIVIKMIMQKAVVDGDIKYNPSESVKVPKNLSKKPREMPSDNDIELIKNNVDKPFGLFPYFLLYTGLRKGEALALTCGDIDRKNKTITVNKSVYHENNKPKIKSTKTEAGERTVILLDKLLDKLPKGKKDQLLFPNDNGEIMTHSEYNRAIKKYQQETGTTCTAHQLRHAYATALYDVGVQVKDAQELLGHTDISTTMDIYTHISKTRKKQIAKLINNMN